MNSIALHINYLLTRHDCVIVPGLGAFLNHYRHAGYDSASGEYLPPSVTVGFNPALDHNDWLLIDSVSRRGGISREAARNAVNEEVRALLCQLHEDGEVPLGDVGMLVDGRGGATPGFVPSERSVSRFDGLAPVPVAPVSVEAEATEALTEDDEERGSSWLSAMLRVAACLVAVMVVGLILMKTSVVHDSTADFASLDSGLNVCSMDTYNIEDALIGDKSAPAPELVIAMPPEEKVEEAVPATPAKPVAKAVRLDGDDPYLVIVASFNTSQQADKFVLQYPDASLGIYFSDDKYRIYAATAGSMSGALQALESPVVKGRFAAGWVLRK